MPRPFPLCPRSHPPRRRAPALLTAGLLLGLTPALATVAEADVIIKEVKVERRRRSLDVVATATTDAPPATRYRMVVQLGERRSKTLVTGTAREGRLELRLAFRGLLLPGDYTCVIEALKDDKSVGATVEKSFGFGSEAERKAAREGVRLWLERALDAVSGLALELELDVRLGDAVEAGQPLLWLHHDGRGLDAARAHLTAAYEIGPTAPSQRPLIIDRIE